MKKITLFAFFVSLQVMAAVPNKMVIVGTAQKIGAKVVTLRTEDGPVNVPRKCLEEPNAIRPNATVTCRVSIEELAAVNQ